MYKVHKILPKPEETLEMYTFLGKRKIQFQSFQGGILNVHRRREYTCGNK